LRSILVPCAPVTVALALLAGCGKEPTPLPGGTPSASSSAAPAAQEPGAGTAGSGAGAPPSDVQAGTEVPEGADPHAGRAMPEGSDPHAGMTMPGGADPHAGMTMTKPGVPNPHAPQGPPGSRALKPQGIGSEAEMAKALAKLPDPALKARFEEGFRACFTSMQVERDYMLAEKAANEVLGKVPGFAPAYRVLAYAKLNNGFDMEGSTELYRKAIAADPEYGEAHYGLAFMLTQMDPVAGRRHLEKAMQLGIPDERDLRSRFYPSGS
jgi:hypothetical protein